jgi:hypothetical protein
MERQRTREELIRVVGLIEERFAVVKERQMGTERPPVSNGAKSFARGGGHVGLLRDGDRCLVGR